MKEINGASFQKERSLYLEKDLVVSHCTFAGPEDGESPLKEGKNLLVEDSHFDLRYPFWHDQGLTVHRCELSEKSRAAFWYDENVNVISSQLHGIKAFRECQKVQLQHVDVVSPEFMWRCAHIQLEDVQVVSEYPFFEDSDLQAKNLTLDGKYSFQYVKGGHLADCHFKTKDAFWHSENLTVTDSVIDGEYLGWYSKNLHLIRCHIKGTQPLCYCQGLVLEDCTMEGCDLAFEASEVSANIKGEIKSVKNPRSGKIVADSIGEVIQNECPWIDKSLVINRKNQHSLNK
jgi:hypothetical protein